MEPVDPSAMRRINTSAALSALHGSGSVTMTRLKELSGLSRRTLELILDPLVDEGWVIDTPPAEGDARPVGRPARTFSFNYEAARVVAIQLDVDSISVLVADLSGAASGESRVSTPVDRQSLTRAERLAKVYACTAAALEDAGANLASVIAATVSTPGIVRDDGTVDLPLSIREWTGFSLALELQKYFPCPVYVENDAKLAAIGEKWAGTGRATKDFVWLRADGVRMGIGVVIGGELYRGNDGAAGEVVWARSLGLQVVDSHVMSALVDPGHPDYGRAVDTAARARAGDPVALASIRELAHALAPGLTTLAWVLAPEEIIVGGALGHIADLLIPALEAVFAQQEHPVEATIVGSQLGSRAMLLGAVKMCLDRVQQLLFSGSELPRVPGKAV